jgi:hypothetical protein
LFIICSQDSEELFVGFEVADTELEELCGVDAFAVAEEEE